VPFLTRRSPSCHSTPVPRTARGVSRRGKKAICEVPRTSILPIPHELEFGSETRLINDWLVAPILERRAHARGVVAVRRGVTFEDEDKEVLILLAQMAASALDAIELGRNVQSSEARLRILIETAPVGIVEADVDGGCDGGTVPPAVYSRGRSQRRRAQHESVFRNRPCPI